MRWLVLVILLAPGAGAASQVHLTYTGDAYAVTFRSDERNPTVGAGSDRGRVAAEAVGGGWFRAEIPGFPSNYTAGERSFPLSAPPMLHEATRVVFVSDMGTTQNASRIAQAIANASPDLVLIAGDLSYAHGDVSEWDRWFDLIEPIASRVPVMSAFGNHDHYCAPNATSVVRCDAESARWEQHFAFPNGEKRYYAFDWGPLRVTTLDTEAYIDGESDRFTDPAEQEAFLRASLDGDADRWDLVMFHRPTRTSLDRTGAALPADDGARLEGILGGAGLVLQAHVHAYERSRPQTNGTIYVTSGGGGRELYNTWGPQPSWVAARASVHHFVILDVSPGRIEARTVDLANATIDSFEMERPVPDSLKPPPPASPTPPRATPTITPTRATTPATPGATAAPTNVPTSDANGSNDPTESKGAPLPSWIALVAVAVALAMAWRRRAKPPSRG